MSSASDILVHLRPCPAVVEFLGVDYLIPAMDAVGWVAFLDGPHPDVYEIFPRMAGMAAVEAVEDALWEGAATYADVEKLGLQVLSTAADRPWYVALNVVKAAGLAWDRVHVNNASGRPLAGWLDELWTNILAHIDPKDHASWTSRISQPPKGAEEEIDFDAEEAAFLAAMNAVAR